jgi:DnaJ-class molecular chaperone
MAEPTPVPRMAPLKPTLKRCPECQGRQTNSRGALCRNCQGKGEVLIEEHHG